MIDILISPTAIGICTLVGLALVAAFVRDNLKVEKSIPPLFRQIRDAKEKIADRTANTDDDRR